MYSGSIGDKSLDDYKALEVMLHRDMMDCCRKYINHLGIVSIIGMIDIVKQETIELEKATKRNIEKEKPETIS